MALAVERFPCGAGAGPVQLGLFDAPAKRAPAAAVAPIPIPGCPAREGVDEAAVTRRYRRLRPSWRACVPVPCLACGRPHGRDTSRTCLCAACEAWRDAKEAAWTLRALEDEAATWAEKRAAERRAGMLLLGALSA